MNKEYYNNVIKKIIKELIEEKDSIVENITNISTYIEFEKESQDLCKNDLDTINLERNNIGAIYKLIEDLEKLKEQDLKEKQLFIDKQQLFIDKQYEKMKKWVFNKKDKELEELYNWYNVENGDKEDLLNSMFEAYADTNDNKELEERINALIGA